ncbi:hypothetical protein ACE7GA_08915 [Roseomonas sp. CCTCC AB2023176]|uniref:hypothetical protein n=1 Tax=Roseomonas sp. CCTCC AB2023176 TaxID=3342640 RepID=UPI0035DF9D64
MRARDWVVVLVLLGAAVVAGADHLRETPIARFLMGECEFIRDWSFRDPARDCSAAPPRWETLPEPERPPLPARRTSWQAPAR